MKKISLTRLIVLTYCMVAGGPVGLEEIIKPVGYIPASLIVFFVPLLWSLPIALLVGHLAGAFPKVEGGFYGWSKLVLGPHLAFLHAWVVLAATIFDMAMYPSLFTVYLAYFLPQVGVSKTWAVIAGMGLIAEGVVVNLFGLKNVGKSSFVSSVLSYAPFGLLIVVVLWCGPLASTAVPGVVLAQAKPITFDQFCAATVLALWNFMGWDNASTISNSVENPQRNYMRGMIGAVILVTLVYLSSILVMAYTGIPHESWEIGFWTKVGEYYGGKVLGSALAIAGMLIGRMMFGALVASYVQLPCALAHDGSLPKIFGRKNKYGAPTWSILTLGALWAGSLTLSFTKLMMLDVMLYGLSVTFQFVVLFIVRRRELRSTQREYDGGRYKIPGGLGSVILMWVPPTILIGIAVYFNCHEEISPGYPAAWLGLTLILAGAFISFVRWLLARFRGRTASMSHRLFARFRRQANAVKASSV